MARNPIPADKSRWGSFEVLREKSLHDLRACVEEVAGKRKLVRGSYEQLVRDFWLSGMNEKQRERLMQAPLADILKRVEAILNTRDLVLFIAWAHTAGFDIGWTSFVGRDDKRSSKNVLHIAQGGLSLPDRDYYLKNDKHSVTVRTAYERYLVRMLSLAGYAKTAKARAATVVKVETALARASMTRVERRDVYRQYNVFTPTKLARTTPNIPWKIYFTATRFGIQKRFIVSQPLFVAEVDNLVATLPLEDIKAYCAWRIIDDLAPALHDRMVREHFAFHGTVLSGAKKMRPLWQWVISTVDGLVGDALGVLYVRKHFNTHAKRRINVLVDNLFAAYRERIAELDWMSGPTKKKALKKLAHMRRKLGYPTKWERYVRLEILPDDYVGNILRAHQYAFRRMARKLKKKPDQTEWFMTPPTVNAYCDQNANEIVFPAGIMQPPFFDAEADDAINYGAIGSVIGHEMTHAFDDEGRKFDHKGNLHDWWTAQDAKRFDQKAHILVDQYNRFVCIDEMAVNGELTLGENIADLGGLVLAYRAFQKSQAGKPRENIDGFTPEQRFFLGYATTEATNIRPELLKRLLVSDPHAPSPTRVNGPLAHMPEFYEAFGVQEGDALYRKPVDRVEIW